MICFVVFTVFSRGATAHFSGGINHHRYIVGIPLLMFVILYKNRKALHNKNHPKHKEVMFEFGGLYSQYEPQYHWFEVRIIIHKCFMTGALVVIGENSSIQPLVATLFQLTFLLVVLKLSP